MPIYRQTPVSHARAVNRLELGAQGQNFGVGVSIAVSFFDSFGLLGWNSKKRGNTK